MPAPLSGAEVGEDRLNASGPGPTAARYDSISRAFEIIAKSADAGRYSCVTFGVVIMFDPSRNGRGFVANFFTRQCHISKTKLRTEIIHLAWIDDAIAN
jgi:hypothetical protein